MCEELQTGKANTVANTRGKMQWLTAKMLSLEVQHVLRTFVRILCTGLGRNPARAPLCWRGDPQLGPVFPQLCVASSQARCFGSSCRCLRPRLRSERQCQIPALQSFLLSGQPALLSVIGPTHRNLAGCPGDPAKERRTSAGMLAQ